MIKQFNAKPISEDLFPIIEHVLNITLWESVKEALKTGNMNILYTGRATGKTLTYILLDCFDGRNIIVNKKHDYIGNNLQKSMCKHRHMELMRIWKLLNRAELPIGDLIVTNGHNFEKIYKSKYLVRQEKTR